MKGGKKGREQTFFLEKVVFLVSVNKLEVITWICGIIGGEVVSQVAEEVSQAIFLSFSYNVLVDISSLM